MSTCYKASDNKYYGCPPRMADGRHFTDYRPSCETDNQFCQENKVSSNNECRLIRQRNASKLMELDRSHACSLNCCSPCSGEEFMNTMLPEKYIESCQGNVCTKTLNDPNGLGLGRNYGVGCPLPAVSKQPQNNCMLPEDILNYQGYGNAVNVMRHSTPNGGNILSGCQTKEDFANTPTRNSNNARQCDPVWPTLDGICLDGDNYLGYAKV
jgi:hypothetical protein